MQKNIYVLTGTDNVVYGCSDKFLKRVDFSSIYSASIHNKFEKIELSFEYSIDGDFSLRLNNYDGETLKMLCRGNFHKIIEEEKMKQNEINMEIPLT